MKRLARAALSALLLIGAFGARDLIAPAPLAACSCVEQSLAKVAAIPDVVIVGGRISGLHVGLSGVQSGTLTISRVYKGAVAALQLTIIGEDGVCGRNLDGMSQIIMAGDIRGAALGTGCLPIADVSTAEGRALLAEAVGLFGPSGVGPDDLAGPPGLDIPLILALAFAGGIAAVVFAVISRRRRAQS